MSLKPSTVLKVGVAFIVVALVASAFALWSPGAGQRRLTAYFTGAVGLYPGADVRILGIKVGEVDKVTPLPQSVRVDMSYDAERKVPAGAQAVVVSQSLVSDRYVQLTPVYTGGPVMADRATLALDRTAVPVEVDQVASSLNNLNKALGPQGANASGSLSRLLSVSADTLQGQGGDIRQTISDTSKMLSTLSEDSGDVAKTIQNLRTITASMQANDQQIRAFLQDLDGASGQLAGEKEELGAALRTLGPTLQNVTRFVKGNRTQLAASIRQLAQITGVLVKNKQALQEFVTVAPLAVNNVARAYDPLSGTIHTRTNLDPNLSNVAAWFCSLAYGVNKTNPKQCEKFLAPLNPLGRKLTGGSGLDISWITAMTTHYDPVPLPPDAYGPNGKKGSGGKSTKSGAAATGTSGTGGATNGLGNLLPGVGGTTK